MNLLAFESRYTFNLTALAWTNILMQKGQSQWISFMFVLQHRWSLYEELNFNVDICCIQTEIEEAS